MSSPVLKIEPEVTKPLVDEVMERSGQNILACYQCRRCAAGCPVGDEVEGVTPDRLIRLIVLGDKQAALENELVWKCVSCYTCGTRCPNEIQTGRITETLKKMAKEAHLTPLEPKVAHFHDSFVGSALRWGRVNEMELMGFYEMKNSIADLKKGRIVSIIKEMTGQAINFGLPMLKSGRLHISLPKSAGKKEIKSLIKKAKQKRSGSKA